MPARRLQARRRLPWESAHAARSPTVYGVRAVVFSTFGDPSVLSVQDVPLPKVGPGQVLVRVEASAVNPVDLAARAGALGPLLPPARYVPGWDVAGIVVEAAPDVTRFELGEAVVGMSDWLTTHAGTHAEHVVLDAAALAPAPTTVPSVEAATLPANGLTALQALDLLDLAPGATLAVTGAAGAVGGFTVQLAALRGLQVIGVGVRAGPGVRDEDRRRLRRTVERPGGRHPRHRPGWRGRPARHSFPRHTGTGRRTRRWRLRRRDPTGDPGPRTRHPRRHGPGAQ